MISLFTFVAFAFVMLIIIAEQATNPIINRDCQEHKPAYSPTAAYVEVTEKYVCDCYKYGICKVTCLAFINCVNKSVVKRNGQQANPA